MEILQWVGFVGGIAAAAYLMLAWGKVYWKKRIDAWVKRRGVVVLSHRGAASFEGPGGLLRSEKHDDLPGAHPRAGRWPSPGLAGLRQELESRLGTGRTRPRSVGLSRRPSTGPRARRASPPHAATSRNLR